MGGGGGGGGGGGEVVSDSTQLWYHFVTFRFLPKNCTPIRSYPANLAFSAQRQMNPGKYSFQLNQSIILPPKLLMEGSRSL